MPRWLVSARRQAFGLASLTGDLSSVFGLESLMGDNNDYSNIRCIDSF